MYLVIEKGHRFQVTPGCQKFQHFVLVVTVHLMVTHVWLTPPSCQFVETWKPMCSSLS